MVTQKECLETLLHTMGTFKYKMTVISIVIAVETRPSENLVMNSYKKCCNIVNKSIKLTQFLSSMSTNGQKIN